MELRAGAADRGQATQLAADRLASMGDQDFRSRMKVERGFRDAVFQVAADVCTRDPFSGRQGPSCQTVRSVVDRQLALKRDERTARPTSAGTHVETTEKAREDWLDELRDRVRY